MDIILNIAVLFLSGLLFARIFGKFKFPDVTGYLIGGILIGPCVLGLLSKDAVKSMEVISQIALSFIVAAVTIKIIARVNVKVSVSFFNFLDTNI